MSPTLRRQSRKPYLGEVLGIDAHQSDSAVNLNIRVGCDLMVVIMYLSCVNQLVTSQLGVVEWFSV